MLLTEILLEMSIQDARDLISRHIKDFPFDNPTPEVVSKARKKLALKFHPDRGGDEEQMKLVNDALDTVARAGSSYEPKRHQYEQPGQEYEYGWHRRQYKKEQERERNRDARRRQSDIPIWAWAGYSGGIHTGVHTEDKPYTVDWLKKRAWEISGR